jgi:hypothetical protein
MSALHRSFPESSALHSIPSHSTLKVLPPRCSTKIGSPETLLPSMRLQALVARILPASIEAGSTPAGSCLLLGGARARALGRYRTSSAPPRSRQADSRQRRAARSSGDRKKVRLQRYSEATRESSQG